jgi:hypothetical protein
MIKGKIWRDDHLKGDLEIKKREAGARASRPHVQLTR